MPRKPRLHLPGGLYHVILRGNDRQDIFFEDEDRMVFYRLLEEGTRRFAYRAHVRIGLSSGHCVQTQSLFAGMARIWITS
jgi:REP element-mobilizing transposase RayT